MSDSGASPAGLSAPLLSALEQYADMGLSRFHLPGHKGAPLPGFQLSSRLDLTELPETGDLYRPSPHDPISRAESETAAFYGAAASVFLSGGASQGVFAMLAALCKPGDSVLLERASHQSAMHSCVLLGLLPSFAPNPVLQPFLIPDAPQLPKNSPPVAASLFTDPNYFGLSAQFPQNSLVDAAHGAHLPLLHGFSSPIQRGARMCVMSAHKTLPALGQAAFVLCRDPDDAVRVRAAAALYGTSSPSFPILASIDAARAYLAAHGASEFRELALYSNALRDKYPSILNLPGIDPCRLTLWAHDGHALALSLKNRFSIACETAGPHYVLLMLSPFNSRADFTRLEQALESLSEPLPMPLSRYMPPLPLPVLSPRTAWFSKSSPVPQTLAEGQIAARAVTPYPPGIPVLWPGERVDKKILEFLALMCYNNDLHCIKAVPDEADTEYCQSG